MLSPTKEVLMSILNLKVTSPEPFKRVQEWIQKSLANQALSICDIEGEEKTNIAKGRIRELKQIDQALTQTEVLIEDMNNNTVAPINKSGFIS